MATQVVLENVEIVRKKLSQIGVAVEVFPNPVGDDKPGPLALALVVNTTAKGYTVFHGDKLLELFHCFPFVRPTSLSDNFLGNFLGNSPEGCVAMRYPD